MRILPIISCLVLLVTKVVISDNEWAQIQVPEQVSGTNNNQQLNSYQEYQEYQPPVISPEGYQQGAIDPQQPPVYAQYAQYSPQQTVQHQIPPIYDNSVYQQDSQVYQPPQPAQYYGGPQEVDTQYAYSVPQPGNTQVNPSAIGQQPIYSQQVQTYQDQPIYKPPPQTPQVNQYQNNPTPYQNYAAPIQPNDQAAVPSLIQSRVDTLAPQSKFSTMMTKIREFVRSFFSSKEGTARNDSPGFAAILSISSLIIGSLLYM